MAKAVVSVNGQSVADHRGEKFTPFATSLRRLLLNESNLTIAEANTMTVEAMNAALTAVRSLEEGTHG